MQTTVLAADVFVCARCGKVKPINHDGAVGYATRVPGFSDDARICYDCCGELDAESLRTMQPGSKSILYWDGVRTISNFMASLSSKRIGEYPSPTL